MKAIFLIGYMGSGKSTLGRALSQRCDVDFIDLDDYIEARAGKKIREIFAEEGEAAFRDLERRMLLEVSEKDNVLVACGGGTPCFGDNMSLMNSRGITVLLQTSHQRLFERLKRGRHKRPLIASLTDEQLDVFIDEQLEKRMPHYSKSAEIFDSTLLEDENQIEEKCNAFIKRFNLPRKTETTNQ
ncbi:shikimate kinase [uncultured Duncaniella sp.]|uniref:shikimate kinase n=1 Tax=uncultured Duncaniella sp. TaxID=2768039 RepID=UPI0023CE5509|nr:shikimate kinase [uncultured Duncaniella sp.]MDE5962286.1 shikimate kinase [Duncaniella sp.]